MIAVAVVTAAACATPTIPVVTAPATPTPVPDPTPSPAPTVANQPQPTPAPADGEPGLTDDEIRVGVIVDQLGDRVNDQMSASAADAVEAWAAAVNAEGGLAGRDVVVERIVTNPLLADHAAAIDTACRTDLFALVGSAATFDADGLEQLESPACRLPDFPAIVNSTERLESTVTTVSNPINGTVWSAGWARWFVENRPRLARNAAAMSIQEFEVSVVNNLRMIEAATSQGYEFVYRPQIPFDTDFSAEVNELVAADGMMLTWRNDGSRLIDLLSRLTVRQVELGAIDCGQACYSRTWVDTAGSLADGVFVWLPTVPLEEADLTQELTRYLFWMGQTSPGTPPTSLGVLAWASALLFEQALNDAVGADTAEYDPTSLTRGRVLLAANAITSWDARGLHGEANPAEGIPSSCFVLLRLTDGIWERTFPERRGSLDCAPENLVELSITSGLGEEQPTPTPTDGEPNEGDEG